MTETKQKKSRKALAVNIMLLIMIISLIIPAVAADNEENSSGCRSGR